MRVLISKEMRVWFLVNILLPIVAPLSAVVLLIPIKLVILIDKSSLEIIKMIWEGGAYIFLSLFITFSLIPHFLDNRKPNRIVSRIYVTIMILLIIITSFLYFSSLSILPKNIAVPFSENLPVLLWITIASITIAAVFKAIVLNGIKKDRNTLISQDVPIID